MSDAAEGPAPKYSALDWALMLLLPIAGIMLVIWRYGRLTGIQAGLIFVHAFVIIIGVNIFMAYSAIHTFPGLETPNSYVASQQFDKLREAQEKLGWSVDVELAGNVLEVAITDRAGNPVEVAEMNAVLGRPTLARDDFSPDFIFNGTSYVAPVSLNDGHWLLRMDAVAKDGTAFHQRLKMHVKR